MNEPHRIDVHQHVTPDVYRTALESIGIKGSGERPWPASSPSTLIEAMDMREAQRTYEANLNVVSVTRQMMGSTLDILRG